MKAGLQEFKNECSKLAYEEWWKESAKLVENEADLALLSNVIHLRFKPIHVRNTPPNENLVRGEYSALVKRPDGKEREFIVCSDWVDANFSKEALEVIQQAGRELDVVHVTRRVKRQEFGYLSVERDWKKKAKKKVKINEIEKQVSQIRYLPPQQITTSGGRRKTLPEAYRGIVHTQDDGKPDIEFVNLPMSWVKDNFKPGLLKMCRSVRMNGTCGFIWIPEGSN